MLNFDCKILQIRSSYMKLDLNNLKNLLNRCVGNIIVHRISVYSNKSTKPLMSFLPVQAKPV